MAKYAILKKKSTITSEKISGECNMGHLPLETLLANHVVVIKLASICRPTSPSGDMRETPHCWLNMWLL